MILFGALIRLDHLVQGTAQTPSLLMTNNALLPNHQLHGTDLALQIHRQIDAIIGSYGIGMFDTTASFALGAHL